MVSPSLIPYYPYLSGIIQILKSLSMGPNVNMRAIKQKQTVTYDFNLILTKEKSPLPSTTATLSEDKDHLIVQEENLSNILYVPKDDTLVFNNVEFIKVNKNDDITKSLEELKNNSIISLKSRYHKYSERFNLESTDTVKIGNITFDDSALIESK